MANQVLPKKDDYLEKAEELAKNYFKTFYRRENV